MCKNRNSRAKCLTGSIEYKQRRKGEDLEDQCQRHILMVNCGTQRQKWELEFEVRNGIILGNDTVNALKIAFAMQDGLDKAR